MATFLSKKYHKNITRLDQIPQEELEHLASRGLIHYGLLAFGKEAMQVSVLSRLWAISRLQPVLIV